VVLNFIEDAHMDLKDSFKDPDYCPKEDSGYEEEFMQGM
jgi:hypothetical protein